MALLGVGHTWPHQVNLSLNWHCFCPTLHIMRRKKHIYIYILSIIYAGCIIALGRITARRHCQTSRDGRNKYISCPGNVMQVARRGINIGLPVFCIPELRSLHTVLVTRKPTSIHSSPVITTRITTYPLIKSWFNLPLRFLQLSFNSLYLHNFRSAFPCSM